MTGRRSSPLAVCDGTRGLFDSVLHAGRGRAVNRRGAPSAAFPLIRAASDRGGFLCLRRPSPRLTFGGEPVLFPRFIDEGRLAQLVRARASHARGHRFESYNAHHIVRFDFCAGDNAENAATAWSGAGYSTRKAGSRSDT